MRFSVGPDDPRFYDVGDDFRDVLIALAPMVAASRMTKARVFHRSSTTARGSLRVADAPDLPAHDFFRPGRRFDVLARYSNSAESDDVAPAIRGVTLRLTDPADGAGMLDLALNTGERFFARTAHIFRRFATGDGAALVAEIPGFRESVWGLYRYATSYAEYRYYSQVPSGFVAADGSSWLARYRLLPAGHAVPDCPVDHGSALLPPEPPAEMTRDPSDGRARTFLHDELRSRVLTSPVESVLQMQLHPVSDSARDDEAALDCTRAWPEERCPWRHVATLNLDCLISNAAIEGLRFSHSAAPATLGTVLATSPHDNASVNHLRTLVYRLAAAARSGEELPVALAHLVSGTRARPARDRRAGPSDESRRVRTVAVVGGGPAGLTIARELERAGHNAIVLEAASDVGGKCQSVDIDGRAYDLGGHICTSQYENLARLAVELGVRTEDTTPHWTYAISARGVVLANTAFFEHDSFSRYVALRSAEFPQIAEPGLAHSGRALAQPVSHWLAAHGLESLAQSLGAAFTASGYGHLTGDLPALYFVKYAEMTGALSGKPGLLGHAGGFTISGGFKQLWDKIVADLSNVRCGVTITAIERDDDASTGGVRIRTDQGIVVADDLVLTAPIDELVTVLDATADEAQLAARVRWVDYYTTVVSARGLPRSAFYFVAEQLGPGSEPGYPVSLHHRYQDRDVYTCYSYGAPDLDGAAVVARLRESIERMGGTLGEIHTQRRWRFLAHFASDAVRDGVYDQIESMQGRRHTYYAGSLPGYELVECVIAHGRELIREYFPAVGGKTALNDLAAVEPLGASTSDRPPPTADMLREWLVENIAAELSLPRDAVAPDARIESFALESIAVAGLRSSLSDWLGTPLPPTVFLEHPTIDAMARNLADARHNGVAAGVPNASAQPSTLLLGLTPTRPFFCIGGAVGAAYYLLEFAREVGSSRQFYGARAPGCDGSEDPLDSVEALAARYIEAIRLVQPEGPYLLGGHSFGGIVAYEIGRQLRDAGERVTRVVLLDTYIAMPGQPLPPVDDVAAIEELLTMNRLANSSRAPAGGKIDPVPAIADQKERLGQFLGARNGLAVEEHVGNMLRVYQANLEANVKYQPPQSDLRVTLLKATDGFPPVMSPHRNTALKLDDPANGWEHVELGELTVVEVPGDHFTMFIEPNAKTVAAVVHGCLAEAEHPQQVEYRAFRHPA